MDVRLARESDLDRVGEITAAAYADFLTGIVVDEADRGHAAALRDLGLQVLVTGTLMKTPDDKRRLAGEILSWLPA